MMGVIGDMGKLKNGMIMMGLFGDDCFCGKLCGGVRIVDYCWYVMWDLISSCVNLILILFI